MKTTKYVDEELKEELFESQIDSEADEATFRGASSTQDGSIDELILHAELSSGRNIEIPIDVPERVEWEDSEVHQLLNHLSITTLDELQQAAGRSIPVSTGDDGSFALDLERVSKDSFQSRIPTITEYQADAITFVLTIISCLIFGTFIFDLAFLFGFLFFIIIIHTITPNLS